jgi:lysophospholipid acyltransferase (LPLAT)-like uncharacterized protein
LRSRGAPRALSEHQDKDVAVKIRNPTIIKWIGFLGAIFIRVWIGTLSFRFRSVGEDCYPSRGRITGRYIYAFWHENILVPCQTFPQRDILVLISQHADGEMIAQVCKHMGWGAIRGSSTRGGIKALREMIRASQSNHFAVMPDGPRGPRRHVELGLIYLAARTGLPIVLLGIGHDRPWRLRTWDRFVVPRPFTQAICIALDPIHIPQDATKAQLEESRSQVEKALNDVTDYAERLASR